jgi:hypothetical protein
LKISREERWLRSRNQIHRVHVSTLKDPKYSKDKAYARVETPAPVTYSTPRADLETMAILDETTQSTMVHEQNTPANDEQQGAINISSPQREREGKATAIRCSVLFPGHVSKQLDRFIAENDIHENEQMEWESLAGCELLCHKCIKIIKSDQHTQLFPRRLLISLLKNLKAPRMGGRKA